MTERKLWEEQQICIKTSRGKILLPDIVDGPSVGPRAGTPGRQLIIDTTTKLAAAIEATLGWEQCRIRLNFILEKSTIHILMYI